jgi:hypothetical protein
MGKGITPANQPDKPEGEVNGQKKGVRGASTESEIDSGSPRKPKITGVPHVLAAIGRGTCDLLRAGLIDGSLRGGARA